jgi:uncharacterized surface anchored protein
MDKRVFLDYGDHHLKRSDVQVSCPTCEKKRKSQSQNMYLPDYSEQESQTKRSMISNNEVPKNHSYLAVYRYDIGNGSKLRDVVYELRGSDGSFVNGVTDEEGLVKFGVNQNRKYLLKEVVPAKGYELDSTSYEISVSNNGAIIVNGKVTNKLVVPSISPSNASKVSH